MCNFVEGISQWGKDTKIIYRQYATLFFIFWVDDSESELGILDLIQVFVETLDNCFENVCELDIIFNMDKVHYILQEIVMGGMVLETDMQRILQSYKEQQDAAKKDTMDLKSGVEEVWNSIKRVTKWILPVTKIKSSSLFKKKKKKQKNGIIFTLRKKHFAKVRVLGCKNLKNEAVISNSEKTNPFVSVFLNHNSHLIGKTEAQHHTCEPTFDDEFTFEFHNDDYIHLHVHHKGELMNYDLGTAKIELKILKEGDQDLWLGLGEKTGEVHIVLTCHDE